MEPPIGPPLAIVFWADILVFFLSEFIFFSHRRGGRSPFLGLLGPPGRGSPRPWRQGPWRSTRAFPWRQRVSQRIGQPSWWDVLLAVYSWPS